MVWSYFEVILTKSGPLHSQHWRVCIELNDTDEAFLNSNTNTELRTQSLVLRSGILDLLPAGLEDSWQRFGTMLEDNVIGTWRGGSDPIIAKDAHKVWIISRRIEYTVPPFLAGWQQRELTGRLRKIVDPRTLNRDFAVWLTVLCASEYKPVVGIVDFPDQDTETSSG